MKPMRSVLFLGVLLSAMTDQALAQQAPAAEEQTSRAAPTTERAKLEQELAERLSGAILVGSFTVTGQENALKEDRYTLREVKKLDDRFWLFNVRIQYGEHDITLPLSLEMKWAGDTPMVTLDNALIPGLGTFTARVLFHKDQYAGTWSGGDHGGHLFGRITRPEDENADEAEPKAD